MDAYCVVPLPNAANYYDTKQEGNMDSPSKLDQDKMCGFTKEIKSFFRKNRCSFPNYKKKKRSKGPMILSR